MSAANPKKQMAEAYVQKHRIPELFENMTAALIHTQPGLSLHNPRVWTLKSWNIPSDNAKKFMIKYLETLKQFRDEKGDYPSMFTDANITAVFGMLDVTNKGFISMEQYRSGNLFLFVWLDM